MRVMTEQVHQGSKRWGIWLLGALAGLVALVLLAEGLSAVWTDYLWFHFTGVGQVWGSIAWTKAGLTAVFVVAAFALSFVSLLLVDKIAPRALLMGPESELVRRYQQTIGAHALLVRIVVSILLGIALGAGAAGPWPDWLLFEHAVPFGETAPLFHPPATFFLFPLPFPSFLLGSRLSSPCRYPVNKVRIASHAGRLDGGPLFSSRSVRLPESVFALPRSGCSLSAEIYNTRPNAFLDASSQRRYS